jgi:uncharacterized protein (TIGR02145 family)
MLDVRGFNGGMNQDAAPELLPNGDYIYAMNVGNGSEGITNLPGNRLPEGFPSNSNPGGEWVCGAFFDKVRQRVIYFTNHERGNHRILSYLVPSIGNEDGSYVVLYEDTERVFSYWDSTPQYDPNLLIKDIKVVHREFEGDLYNFIDPKKILLKFNYDNILSWSFIDNTLCALGWTDANYDGTFLSDGTPIPEVTDQAIWTGLTIPAWCYYNNDPANNSIYGKLYNWYAVSHPLFAPPGYRVPTESDWNDLITCLGGDLVAGGKMKSTSSLWIPQNPDATNESLFSGIPGGARNDDGSFIGIREFGSWWSSTEVPLTFANRIALYSNPVLAGGTIISGNYSKSIGSSIRFIKNI